MTPTAQESVKHSDAAPRELPESTQNDSPDDGAAWPLGPLADAAQHQPGSDPYNCTGRLARPIFK